MSKLKVLFLSYECAPFIKKGGLGDVALGLPKDLIKLGVDCRVIIPKYSLIDDKKYKLKLIKSNIPVQLKNKVDHFNLFESTLPSSKVPIYFIDHKYFRLKNIFGYKNDGERFLFFSQTVLTAIKSINFQVDILHSNDWHTGLIPLLLKKEATNDDFYKKIKTIYTIHNLGYQGKKGIKDITQYDIKKEDLISSADINPMAQGIANANIVNTVSKTYAKEILTKEYGVGLEKLLQKRKKQNQLVGIVNGIDYEDFNPKTDSVIKQTYDLKTIQKKEINKTDLQKIFNLETNSNLPVIGLISRLTDQKGLDLVLDWLKKTKAQSYQFILIGTGDKKYEKDFADLSKKYTQIKTFIGFDVKLAIKIYAGADMFLMPSQYEPCGLGQLIAMRYGTVPIVRQTGGLKDTVKNYSTNSSSAKATGFSFVKYDSIIMEKTINQAIKIYNNKTSWDKLVKNCMLENFSWKHAAEEYIKIYKKLNI